MMGVGRNSYGCPCGSIQDRNAAGRQKLFVFDLRGKKANELEAPWREERKEARYLPSAGPAPAVIASVGVTRYTVTRYDSGKYNGSGRTNEGDA